MSGRPLSIPKCGYDRLALLFFPKRIFYRKIKSMGKRSIALLAISTKAMRNISRSLRRTVASATLQTPSLTRAGGEDEYEKHIDR
jgi:hypothetical protein